MPKASTYSNDTTLTGGDKFLGTDAADSSTKNFTISGLESFLASNGSLATLSTAQTLTNKTIDADNNTITNLAHGSEVDNPSSGVHGVAGSVVGTTDTQTLTNKTMDFSSGGTNTITADSSDIDYDNATSGLTATNVKTAIDEVASDSNANTTDIAELKLSYDTANEATASYTLDETEVNKINARGNGDNPMTTTFNSTLLGTMTVNDIVGIHRTGSGTSEIVLSGVTDLGGATGTITINRQGGIAWIKAVSGGVLLYGDITITP